VIAGVSIGPNFGIEKLFNQGRRHQTAARLRQRTQEAAKATSSVDALFPSRPQFVPDSLLEGNGFELSVPRRERNGTGSETGTVT
jgi:hypothetical protein